MRFPEKMSKNSETYAAPNLLDKILDPPLLVSKRKEGEGERKKRASVWSWKPLIQGILFF